MLITIADRENNPMPEPINTKPPMTPPSRPSWSGWLMLVLLLAGMWAWQLFGRDRRDLPTIAYSAFYSLVEDGKVASVQISGQSVSGKLNDAQQIDSRTLHEF